MNISPFIERVNLSPLSSGTLSSLSFAVKDFIAIQGTVTGCGNPTWRDTHAKEQKNATVVDQLRNAGATCLGKTISDEMGFSLSGKNHFYGTPLNSNAPKHVPGGSSSGSASAVTNRLVDFSLGTDTAGSVRVPASHCGIFGMRPSQGIHSSDGLVICSPTFDTIGIFSNTLEILSKVAQVIYALENVDIEFDTIFFLDDAFEIADNSVIQALQKPINKIKKSFANKCRDTSLSSILNLPN